MPTSTRAGSTNMVHLRLNPTVVCESAEGVKCLLNFLFQRVENLCAEKIAQGDFQTVAEFFDGNNGNILAGGVHHAVCSRGGYAGQGGQFVYLYLPLFA